MEREHEQYSDNIDLSRGLPMFTASAAEAIEREKIQIAQLKDKSFLKRWLGYSRMTGPGWLQSALTLGGGSAMASLFAGAYSQYKLLWVQPLAMLLGVLMLIVVSRQTLDTGARPFAVIRRFIHPSIAWLWAFGALTVTVIWHFPQYALAAGMIEDMVKAATGWMPSSTAQTLLNSFTGLFVLVISTLITWNYGKGLRGVRLYERTLKILVWMIICTFSIVIIRRTIIGGIQWNEIFKGFLPLYIPTDRRGVSVTIAAFSAAVGINSTFLLPYTLLARGWSKQHEGLSVFDLITGTLLPFSIVVSLVVIAAGCTIYSPDALSSGSTQLSPTVAASMFHAAGLGMFFSRIVFGLGILGMVLTTITIHMLMSGFAVCEIFGVEPGGWRYKLACLLPAPGATGVLLWKHIGPWIAVSASAVTGLLLPFAYIIFFILNNNSKYLGKYMPRGAKAFLWNIVMLTAIGVSAASAVYFVYTII